MDTNHLSQQPPVLSRQGKARFLVPLLALLSSFGVIAVQYTLDNHVPGYMLPFAHHPSVLYYTQLSDLSISLVWPTALLVMVCSIMWIFKVGSIFSGRYRTKSALLLPLGATVLLVIQLGYNRINTADFLAQFEPSIATLKAVNQPGGDAVIARQISLSGAPLASLTTFSSASETELCEQLTQSMSKFNARKSVDRTCTHSAVINGMVVSAQVSDQWSLWGGSHSVKTWTGTPDPFINQQ